MSTSPTITQFDLFQDPEIVSRKSASPSHPSARSKIASGTRFTLSGQGEVTVVRKCKLGNALVVLLPDGTTSTVMRDVVMRSLERKGENP